MSRLVALIVATTALLVAALAGAAQAGAEDEAVTYQRYAEIREGLHSCLLQSERGWNTQDAEDRADCRRLQRRYVLYAWTGEGYLLHVHCRSPQRCIPTPSGEPRADGPIPEGATVYDVKVAAKSAHKKKHKRKRKRHHRRARR